MPSFNLYRVALLVMLVGTAVAVFLILKPPGDQGGASAVVVGGSGPTPAGSNAQATVPIQTPSSTNGSGTATGTTTAGVPPQSTGDDGTATAASGTATPASSATESPFGEHVIVEGDTLFAIAQANLPPGDDPVSFGKAIANLNGLDYENPILTVGKTLLLPKPASR
jgi:LysM repeat protein